MRPIRTPSQALVGTSAGDPSQGGGQRFFDDSRVTFPQVSAGTTLRIVKEQQSGALPLTVDLVETEVAPAPLSKPAGYVDIRGLACGK